MNDSIRINELFTSHNATIQSLKHFIVKYLWVRACLYREIVFFSRFKRECSVKVQNIPVFATVAIPSCMSVNTVPPYSHIFSMTACAYAWINGNFAHCDVIRRDDCAVVRAEYAWVGVGALTRVNELS